MKTPVLEPLFNKVVRLGLQLYLKETPVYSFYHCEYCGIFKNSFFIEQLRWLCLMILLE